MMRNNVLLFLCLTCLAATQLQAQSGTLDPGFSGDGMINTSTAPIVRPTSIVIQPDGKILIGGYIHGAGTEEDFGMMRLLENGDFDTSFGTGGGVKKDMGGRDFLRKIILLPDGKILAAGIKFDATANEFIVARFKSNGQIDSTFADQGISRLVVPTISDLRDIVVLPDNKILLGGAINNNNIKQISLARLLPDGTIDSTLSDDGVLLPIPLPVGSWITKLAVQQDGKILATGTRFGDSPDDPWYYFTARFLPNFALDNTFGTNGYLEELFSEAAYSGEPTGIAVQNDGKIIIGGFFNMDAVDGNGLAIRYTPNGVLDPTFGLDGKAFVPYPVKIYNGAMVMQADGKIVIGGSSTGGPLSTETDEYVARFTNDGQLDSSFASSGISILPKSGTADYILALALQDDGKIMTAGKSNDPNLFLTRYLNNFSVGLLSPASSDAPMPVYPNPVAQEATLHYELAQQEPVTIRLFDLNGVLLATYLNHQTQSPGAHVLNFSLPDALPAGSYVLTLNTEKSRKSIQLVKG